MLYQLSHVRMPVPSRPGPVRRIAPALRQNCIRSWRNHQLRTEGTAKNLSLERTRLSPSPPLPQISAQTSAPAAPETARDPCHARHPRPPWHPVTRAIDRLVTLSSAPRAASGSCRLRRPLPRHPVAYAIDRPGVLSPTPSTAPIGVAGVADRSPFGSMASPTDVGRSAWCLPPVPPASRNRRQRPGDDPHTY